MKPWISVFISALLLLCPSVYSQPVAIDDASMAKVVGRDGIALQIELDLNAQGDSSKTATLNNDMKPLASLNSCTGIGTATTPGNPCRVAIETNRPPGGYYQGGEWLVFKDTYASFRIFTLLLDGSTLGSASSNTAYFDPTRFASNTGSCLLPVGCASATAMNGLNALIFSFPAVSTSYNSSTGVSSGYTSMQMGLDIGRMSLEFGPTGYNTDANPNSFLGVRMADNNGPMAGIAVQGKAFVYGF